MEKMLTAPINLISDKLCTCLQICEARLFCIKSDDLQHFQWIENVPFRNWMRSALLLIILFPLFSQFSLRLHHFSAKFRIVLLVLTFYLYFLWTCFFALKSLLLFFPMENFPFCSLRLRLCKISVYMYANAIEPSRFVRTFFDVIDKLK